MRAINSHSSALNASLFMDKSGPALLGLINDEVLSSAAGSPRPSDKPLADRGVQVKQDRQ